MDVETTVNLSRGRTLTYAAQRLTGRWAATLCAQVMEPYYYCRSLEGSILRGITAKSLDDVGMAAVHYRFKLIAAAFKPLLGTNTFYFIGRGECKLSIYEFIPKNVLCLEKRVKSWGRVRWIPIQIPQRLNTL